MPSSPSDPTQDPRNTGTRAVATQGCSIEEPKDLDGCSERMAMLIGIGWMGVCALVMFAAWPTQVLLPLAFSLPALALIVSSMHWIGRTRILQWEGDRLVLRSRSAIRSSTRIWLRADIAAVWTTPGNCEDQIPTVFLKRADGKTDELDWGISPGHGRQAAEFIAEGAWGSDGFDLVEPPIDMPKMLRSLIDVKILRYVPRSAAGKPSVPTEEAPPAAKAT